MFDSNTFFTFEISNIKFGSTPDFYLLFYLFIYIFILYLIATDAKIYTYIHISHNRHQYLLIYAGIN